jgi:hypothetical protein
LVNGERFGKEREWREEEIEQGRKSERKGGCTERRSETTSEIEREIEIERGESKRERRSERERDKKKEKNVKRK